MRRPQFRIGTLMWVTVLVALACAFSNVSWSLVGLALMIVVVVVVMALTMAVVVVVTTALIAVCLSPYLLVSWLRGGHRRRSSDEEIAAQTAADGSFTPPSTRSKVMALLAVVVGAMIFVSWAVVESRRAREEARRAQCVSNLKQLGLALHNYDSSYGCLPPPYVADAHGRPLYSWRVVLMAYLEKAEGWNGGQLTTNFRFDEPWDSPHNRKLHGMRAPNFFCPSDPASAENGFTSFVAVVGPRTLFPGGGQVRRLADVRNDSTMTVMLVESANRSIHWMEPRDLAWEDMSFVVNDRSRPSISSLHRAPQVLHADGSVTYLPPATPPEVVKAPLMIDGLSPN